MRRRHAQNHWVSRACRRVAACDRKQEPPDESERHARENSGEGSAINRNTGKEGRFCLVLPLHNALLPALLHSLGPFMLRSPEAPPSAPRVLTASPPPHPPQRAVETEWLRWPAR